MAESPSINSWKKLAIIAGVAVVVLAAGCGDSQRIAQLEKQNEEFKAQLARNQAATDFDLQAKCSKDAKTWFDENFPSDKDTILLDRSNHYNKEQNKCLVMIEWHYKAAFYGEGSWTNHMSLWDVYENTRLGEVVEQHIIEFKPPSTRNEVQSCNVLDKKCTSVGEFNVLVRPYMSK
jgi:outer membrane murein-binding lipoprotein Lpp